MKHADFLIEIQTEELPPKSLLTLAEAFEKNVDDHLTKSGLAYEGITRYVTPRRLALLIRALAEKQPDQVVEKRGPAVTAAFKEDGTPTPACLGFAKSCGLSPDALGRIKTAEGEWVGVQVTVPGQAVEKLMPSLLAEAVAALPVGKRMRWGDYSTEFSRPVRGVIMLYGDQIIEGQLLGCTAGRTTVGHRFHAPQTLSIPTASAYADILAKEGKVIADPILRAEKIASQVKALLKPNEKICALNDDDLQALTTELIGLVEWPCALRGSFEEKFLRVPKEVLISSMIDHQRYYPIADEKTGALLPAFITISNIESKDATRVIHGNERVIRARLSDAAFFFESDEKTRLDTRLDKLSHVLYQAKLGTLKEKAERISQLAAWLAKQLGADATLAARAGLLAKADLVTSMVGEFPELQGVMGGYYAAHDGEAKEVALAVRDHYYPRFAGDRLPEGSVSLAVALADRLDLLTGYFGIKQFPTGDKDPYGLRRAALGVVRCLVESACDIDLSAALAQAVQLYGAKLENANTAADVLSFIQERLRPYYQERGITPDVVAAVLALGVSRLNDVDKRIAAVQAFKSMEAALALSAANKRVSNILAKYPDSLEGVNIDAALFENEAESTLAQLVEAKEKALVKSFEAKQYQEALTGLAELREPVDTFFDQVMVMTDDKARRTNRVALLAKLRHLFLKVADIALLQ